MADVISGPTIANLPLWIGEDTTFVIKRRSGVDEDGNPVYVDYDAGTTARIQIDPKDGDQIEAEATISGSTATFTLRSTQTDHIKKDSLWRVQFTLPSIGDKVPIAGKVVRKGE